MPEREPHAGLYAGTDALLSLIAMDDDDTGWLEGYVRWELGLLHAAGYQLDLDRCAASGETTNLAYVSPKSGQAVSQHHAGHFANRLLALPKFLGGVACPAHDWVAGLDLTGHFLAKRFLPRTTRIFLPHADGWQIWSKPVISKQLLTKRQYDEP